VEPTSLVAAGDRLEVPPLSVVVHRLTVR